MQGGQLALPCAGCAHGGVLLRAIGVCVRSIHAGTSCSADALGHYYRQSAVPTDPWTSISYTSDSSGEVSEATVSVDTGGYAGDVAGRTVLVHGHDGARIACGILASTTEVTLTATSFVPYYTYAGNLAVRGTIGPMTTTDGTTQTFSYSLTGTDPSCADGVDSSKANSCGIHIHAGTSCTRHAEGHYYASGLSDPWTNVVYTPDAEGVVSAGSATVATGLTSQSVAGRTLIVHDKTGARIACAILGTGGTAALRAEGFVPYYNNPGFSVSGSVGPLTTSGTTQTFTYDLAGVDPLCSSGADTSVANSCGIQCAALCPFSVFGPALYARAAAHSGLPCACCGACAAFMKARRARPTRLDTTTPRAPIHGLRLRTRARTARRAAR